MKGTMFQRNSKHLCYLAFAPLHSFSLTLNTPVAGKGYSAILSNGSATVSWTYGAGDPSVISFEIQNNLTLDSWEFARGVNVTLGSITRNLDNVSGDGHYFMQAVNVSNVTHVYAESPTFTVAGIAVTTTNPIPNATSTSTSNGPNIATLTTTVGATESSPIPVASTNSGGMRVGAIVAIVIAAVLLVCAILAGIFCCRRRRPKARNFTVVTPDPYPSHLDGEDRLARMRSEKAAVERHHDQLQSDLERDGTDTSRAPLDSSNGGPGEAETLLRQVQVMSERILELEAQQREDGLFDRSSLPPPGYTPTAVGPSPQAP